MTIQEAWEKREQLKAWKKKMYLPKLGGNPPAPPTLTFTDDIQGAMLFGSAIYIVKAQYYDHSEILRLPAGEIVTIG